MQEINQNTSNPSRERPSVQTITDWFDEFISHISIDKMMMETNTASPLAEKMYSNFINKDLDATNNFLRVQSTGYFIRKIVECYLSELSPKIFPQKLAFDFSDAKILVWAQIQSGNEELEDALILAEAEANARYSDNGFYISSTIVEDTDNLSIPPHYHEVNFHGRIPGTH